MWISLTIVSLVVKNGDPLIVVQQPYDDPYFLSSEENVVTELLSAQSHGSIGLVAHNDLAGETFNTAYRGDHIEIQYSDGEVVQYEVVDILLYYALEPNNPYSEFINLNDPFTIMTSGEVFEETYGVPDRLVLQTCMTVLGITNWGRLFVIAEKVKEGD